ncbi:MAG: TIGR04255 family protein [Novosphingobium sp.]|nr:TIGR04255 family protein [Novosphingobium sp.]
MSNDRAQLYDRPPIVEAVIEIRFSTAIAENRRKKARDWLANKYAASSIEQQAEVKVHFSSKSADFKNLGPTFTLSSSDQTDGCAINAASIVWVRRAPYEGWEQFKSRFATEMPQALKALGDPNVERIGLRYVNRIDVKIENNEARYEDFLNFRIEHGDLLEPTTSYQWYLTKEFLDINLKTIVQSASVQPEIPGYGAFSFDIDVFCDSKVPSKADEILTKVEEMRDLKNKIFEAGITDEARKQYS